MLMQFFIKNIKQNNQKISLTTGFFRSSGKRDRWGFFFASFTKSSMVRSLDLTMYGYDISNEVSPKNVSTSVQQN